MKKLLDIIDASQRQVVVLSAVSGTTNNLVEIGQAYLAGDKNKAGSLIKVTAEHEALCVAGCRVDRRHGEALNSRVLNVPVVQL